jgi:16S rRNA (adenine(1408)-N(1))-methyltransferase
MSLLCRWGRSSRALAGEELEQMRARSASVLIDVGTGDGRFVYRYAQQHPDVLCIGLDPVAENMDEVSRKSAGKRARPAVANALFVVASLEQLPSELAGIADHVTVNYPWGSLLRAVLGADAQSLAKLAALGRAGARLDIVLNASVFEDAEYCARLGVPRVTEELAARELAERLSAASIRLLRLHSPGELPPYRTSWGQRLVQGSGRTALWIEAELQGARANG